MSNTQNGSAVEIIISFQALIRLHSRTIYSVPVIYVHVYSCVSLNCFLLFICTYYTNYHPFTTPLFSTQFSGRDGGQAVLAGLSSMQSNGPGISIGGGPGSLPQLASQSSGGILRAVRDAVSQLC